MKKCGQKNRSAPPPRLSPWRRGNGKAGQAVAPARQEVRMAGDGRERQSMDDGGGRTRATPLRRKYGEANGQC